MKKLLVSATVMLALSANMIFLPQHGFAEVDETPSVETVTSAPTEKATQAPAGESTETPMLEPAQTLAEEQTAEPTQEPVDEQTAEPTREAADKQTIEPTQAATGEPAQSPTPVPFFSSGYAMIKKDARIYDRRSAKEEDELGQFTDKAFVYVLERFGNGESEDEWMRIAFAVKTENGVKLEEGYVKASRLEPVSAEKSEALKAQLSAGADCVYCGSNGDIPLAAASFEMNKEETETAVSTPEPAEGSQATPGADNIQESTPEPIEEQEILIEASWAQETLGIGDVVTLTALYEGDCTVVWQYADETGVWQDAGLTGLTYEYVLTMENYAYAWRVILEPAVE